MQGAVHSPCEKKLEERNLGKCIMKELTLREGDEGLADGTARHV